MPTDWHHIYPLLHLVRSSQKDIYNSISFAINRFSYPFRVRSFDRIQKRIWRHWIFGFAVFNGMPNPKKVFQPQKHKMSRYYERGTGDWDKCYLLNPFDHNYSFRIRSQWNAWISDPKIPDLDWIYRILPQGGFNRFQILFWNCPKARTLKKKIQTRRLLLFWGFSDGKEFTHSEPLICYRLCYAWATDKLIWAKL